MADRSGIEWTDATWNPVRGCTRVSEGCRNCYAERQAARFSGPRMPFEGFAINGSAGPRWTGEVALIPSMLDRPLRWKRPRRIFVNSMSDLFHELLPFEAIAAVFGVMAAAPRHTFQVLTKRPERALEFFAWAAEEGPRNEGDHPAWACAREADFSLTLGWIDVEHAVIVGEGRHLPEVGFCDRPSWPLPNIEIGVSVEDQATADERIPLLLQCPAAVRFVSYEPALGPVDWEQIAPVDDYCVTPLDTPDPSYRLHWVIVGGESGPNARPFDLAWARSTIAQCREAGVPCFVKQLGRRPELSFSTSFDRSPAESFEEAMRGAPYWPPTDPKGGDPLEWPEDLRVREFPATPTPEAAQRA